jgi:VWFA-related protein
MIAMRTAIAVLVLAALQRVPGPAPAPPPALPVIAVPAGLVPLHVIAESQTGVGRPAALGRDQISLRVDGQPRPIEFFSASDEPVTAVLLFDTTISFRNRFGTLLLQSAIDRSFLPGISRRDRLRVGTFAGQVSLMEEFTSARQPVLDAIRAAATNTSDAQYGPSPIWDAIDAAVAALEREPGRRAIVLITDGRSTANRVSYRDAGLRAMNAGVFIHIVAKDTEDVVYRTTGLARTYDAETALRWLAAQTGGTFQADNRPRTPGDRGQNVGFDRLLARATSTLHQMYTLGFRPAPAPVRAHTIDVVSANPDVKLHVRAGYTDK